MAEAGNMFEHVIRDSKRFDADKEYRDGWLAGQKEGVSIQSSANQSGAYFSGASMQKQKDKHDLDRAAKDAVKDVDTSDLKNLK